ncbi:YitT family protein [Cytophagaceae bacterium DM2B3-1]|uniref:YitT family protein n=1 Tax=Xanthocytophaga flava TaxID=3048013 RepID=A0ABT7CWJ9_9BACT|nr:YitT family protein [Xanthocytophaga flavus]MDJ1472205.1 YitT family protein [Xanthocytophaga flavus]MDJ1496989.1 YitT family protein [Xanthocytophaga flavus]
MKEHTIRIFKDVILISFGILSAGMGLKGFLSSSGFIDGGVTGISMLLADVMGIPLAILILLFNIPFIIVGYKQIGKWFALKSILAIAGLSLCLAFIRYPDITPDLLLTAVFGGFFIGAGIGLAMRGGAVLDGTEIAALLISRQTAMFRVGDIILVMNIFIFSAAAFLKDVQVALYSILTYFAASKTLDFILHGIEEYTALIIISDKSEEIRLKIINELRRGITVIKGKKGLSGVDQDILFCVVTRLEMGRVKRCAQEIDKDAFIVIDALSDAEGGLVKKSKLH